MRVDSSDFRMAKEGPAQVRWRLFRGIAVVATSLALAAALHPGSSTASEGSELTVGLLASQASTAIDEAEPNDGYDTATAVKMNRNVYGIFGGYNDSDYFVVDLPESGSVRFTFTNDKYSNGGMFGTHIYNRYYEWVSYSNGDLHNRVSCSTTRPVSANVSLAKGRNYLVVDAGAFGGTPPIGQPYHFKLSYNIPSTTAKAAASKRAFTVKWTKKSGAAKYQLRYTTKKNMSGAKAVNVSKNKGSKKISGLKSNKKYYVQVRVVKTIGGETYYSPWSAKKSVKTK